MKLPRKKRILVFSPDRDLAGSLSLLLERNFEIVCETTVEKLRERIESFVPALLLIDLFSYSKDIFRVLEILKASEDGVPIIVLHVFQQRNPSVEAAIQDVASLVLYKPLDVELIGKSITKLLQEKQSKVKTD